MQTTQILQILISSSALAVLFGILGVYTVQRGLSFWGDGLAHASLAGIAVALLTGWQPLPLALIVSVLFAFGIFFLEEKTTLKKDALIGILFTAFMSLGLILSAGLEEGHHVLEIFLFGDLDTMHITDAYLITTLSLLAIFIVWYFRKQFNYISVDSQGAYLSGMNVRALNLLFYVLLAISVVLGAKIMGVILVSALLIIPASAAQLLSSSMYSWRRLSVAISLVTLILGLAIAILADLPSGSTIILTGTVIFILSLLFKR